MIRTFAELDLDSNLLDAIEEMGFERPTKVQAEAIPQALDGRDILASAPTGTGKTAAFVLPALQYLQDFPRRKPGPARILILTPTRELAMQVADQARALAKNTSSIFLPSPAAFSTKSTLTFLLPRKTSLLRHQVVCANTLKLNALIAVRLNG